MYLTQSNVIRGLSKQDYAMLREMCQYSNNLYNVAVYTIRQHYFENDLPAYLMRPNGGRWPGYIMTSGNIARLSSNGSWKRDRGSIILRLVPC